MLQKDTKIMKIKQMFFQGHREYIKKIDKYNYYMGEIVKRTIF